MTPFPPIPLIAALFLGMVPMPNPEWVVLGDTSVAARLRGVSAVSSEVAWASGGSGTVVRTLDRGLTWTVSHPAGLDDLQFRDIEAFDADNAVVMSIGPGDLSRIYRTNDGGKSWRETFRNPNLDAFYDCVTFFDRMHGIALSDPVAGKFQILSTSDSGYTWKLLPDSGMPRALSGEFAFAASGSCLVTSPYGFGAWFATGGGSQSQVYRTFDQGHTWTASKTPIPSGNSSGVYSLAFRDPLHGIAVGGSFDEPASPSNAAITRDGGLTWTLSAKPPGVYRSAVSWIPFAYNTAVAVGPAGTDISYDGGKTWFNFSPSSLDAISCAPWRARVCWGAGENGRVRMLR